MSRHTDNLQLTIWDETDFVDFEDLNDNFEKLDILSLARESGTATATYSGGSSGSATWHYKIYTDGTVDMSTLLTYTNMRCNGGSEAPYYSDSSVVNFPFQFSSIYDIQMHLVSDTVGWISDITSQSANDHITFRVMGMTSESTPVYKQVYVNVKGVLATV